MHNATQTIGHIDHLLVDNEIGEISHLMAGLVSPGLGSVRTSPWRFIDNFNEILTLLLRQSNMNFVAHDIEVPAWDGAGQPEASHAASAGNDHDAGAARCG